MQLRQYQHDLIEQTRQALRRHSSVMLQSPTGSGKTALTVTMMGNAAEAGKRAMFCVHQNELLQQTSRALWEQNLQHGQVASGRKVSRMPVQVASVQTLVRRMDKYPEPDLIVIDEAHRAAASTYRRILEHWPNAKVVGLTATPERTDGKGLSDLFSDIVEGPTVRQLIDAGFLCDYELFAPKLEFDLSGIKNQAGDYKRDELAAEMDKPTITGDAVSHYLAHCKGKRCVTMCVTIEHAEHVAAQYNHQGVPAEAIEGSLSNDQREAMLKRFERAETQVICGVNLMVEGLDIPAIEVIQWLRPTQSLIVYMQGNGRGLRPHKGKDKLTILDHVGNANRHGLPCDDREWSLEGRKKRKRKAKEEEEEDVQIQQCKSCYAVFRPGPSQCPACGVAIEKKQRQIEQVDGELNKVDVTQLRKERRKEVGRARTMRDLVGVGVRRGMNKPGAWAAITLSASQGRKPTAEEFSEAKRIEKQVRGEVSA